ncbi:Glyoxal oxidase-related protein, putative [Theobroma cacao]|uniref:Glyoxal oxidase-related protein, putative n=1 Tax=Theobroma cacao TaxID=3641 RepID=A0A061GMW3_THECC|nr:Glyoxal oxidase-related protein, putative [Theobroma cacao]
MTMLWRGLCILPLLFVSGNCQFLFPFFHPFNNPGNGLNLGGVVPQNANGFFPFSGGSPSGGSLSAQNKDDGSLNSGSVNVAGGSADNKKWESNAKDKIKTGYKGKWELFVRNAGVSAMHLILLPKIDQALMFDATVWKQSKLKLPGPPCRDVEGTNEQDCFCHSILLDIDTAKIRPLRLKYDTWCSSGALDVNGRLVSTGGYNNGSDTVRILDLCPTCDWKEYPGTLGNGRWYATQVTLGDGRFMVFGGRNFPTYEFVPPEGQRNDKSKVIPFKFLAETHDKVENNLYPFVYLSTDGNLFVFANNRSILLNPNNQKILHEFPVLPGGARNYPASGSSCLLPITLQPDEKRKVIPAEVLICGGTSHDAFTLADLKRPKVFVQASKDCARIDITKRNGKWKIQSMPSPRLMGDAVVLPTGDVLLINGAKSGSAGWDDAREPNFTPVLYNFRVKEGGSKFTELAPSTIPRMYHSSFALLPDGKILIAGSNTNPGYQDNALFPTEVRVEKFSPHYLDPALAKFRPEIVPDQSANKIHYGKRFTVQIRGADRTLDDEDLQVNIYYPAFTTHGISMNQRLVRLGIVQVDKNVSSRTHSIKVQAPINGNIAPPGYYMLFVIQKGVPCRRAMWVQMLP